MRQDATSPSWENTTKLIVGLTLVAITAGLLIQFKNFLGPLLLSFVLAYIFHPIILRIRKWVKLPWRLTVILFYLVMIVVLLGLLTWGGFTLVDSAQSLVSFLQRTIQNLPKFFADLSTMEIEIGPFEYDLGMLNLGLQDLANQVLSMIQPVLSQVGVFLGSLASSAATQIGWGFFIILISYFILSESDGLKSNLIQLNIPGYQHDVQRMGEELSRIWNAFLRGELVLILLTMLIYTVFLGVVGVRFFVGLAFLAGMARFIPYVGPGVTWIVYFLVSFFQAYTPFGLSPLLYSLLVVGIALLIDNYIDSFVTPKMMGDALRIHPAAVLVAALVGANLLGLVGVLLAAPTLATCQLMLNYVTRKLFDLDPWTDLDTLHENEPEAWEFPKFAEVYKKIHKLIIAAFKSIKQKLKPQKRKSKDEQIP